MEKRLKTNLEFWEDFFSKEPSRIDPKWWVARERAEGWNTCAVGTKLFPHYRRGESRLTNAFDYLNEHLYIDGNEFNQLIKRGKFREARLLFYEILYYGDIDG